ncbi:MAG: ATP synthase F1 subunit gamma [Oscillospiraceae bacterium]|nr:ATP synthase F1 subunit gamma [Oscillospiraceae bacterium]
MAGVSTKEIKNRIRSMESTKQITKAMEMVAASKLRRAQAQISSSRPYFEILYSTIQDITRANKDFSSPYLREREVRKVMYIVIAGDRGLAGGYNSNILKMVYADIQGKDAVVLPIGKKAVDFFKSKGIPCLTDLYAEAADVSIGDCFSISKRLCNAFLAEEFDQVYVAYTQFVSVLSQVPTSMSLLPLKKPEPKPSEDVKRSCDTIYEGDPEEVFASIVPEYLGGILYGALCESRAAEQAARRSAMDSATQNADEMIADLSLKFNRARQAAITQEITEIVAGS